ncbi:hypothetical protein GCM10010270_80120 [Streptomyces violaceus]|nr:hypothetical protein GCM10010270_80120 [Streptomyces janthinus]
MFVTRAARRGSGLVPGCSVTVWWVSGSVTYTVLRSRAAMAYQTVAAMWMSGTYMTGSAAAEHFVHTCGGSSW